MKSADNIKQEIELLREVLNEKIKKNNTRKPNDELIEISQKMDNLLNELGYAEEK